MNMDFVSESTKEELLRLEHEFNETKKSLAKLEKQYIGHTPAQQETLNKLKQMDMYYIMFPFVWTGVKSS